MSALHGLPGKSLALLVLCLAVALGFELVNGFHDTANAVATVIYTRTLRPRVAVVLSGVCNFAGVFLGGIGVAVGIMKLLPVDLLVQRGPGVGIAMVLALLFSAILWNLGTWYLGLPASSSHTLIGAILGVGLANGALSGHGMAGGVSWAKAGEVGASLVLSPLVGFSAAALVLMAARSAFRRHASIFRPAPRDAAPPLPVRALLVLTCGGVSFGHGMNDGQKGVGVVMLILMGLVPAGFALDRDAGPAAIERTVAAGADLRALVEDHAQGVARAEADRCVAELDRIGATLAGRSSVADVPPDQRFEVRRAILLADRSIEGLLGGGRASLSRADRERLAADREALRALTDYAPRWVLLAIALSLGVGTMIGWRRVVVTIGEKIGGSCLTYAQGASAEIVAASTIVMASTLGLPVSTTHVLSSGIAGTMVAQKAGLQGRTVRAIALAWVLTLPAALALAALLFLGLRTVLA